MSLADYSMYKHASTEERIWNSKLRSLHREQSKIQRQIQREKNGIQQYQTGATTQLKQALSIFTQDIRQQQSGLDTSTETGRLDYQKLQQAVEDKKQETELAMQEIQDYVDELQSQTVEILEPIDASMAQEIDEAQENSKYWKNQKDQYKQAWTEGMSGKG